MGNSMDWSDWNRVTRWMRDRWPNRKPWPESAVASTKQALIGATEADVWEWLNGHLETRPEFPPQPAEVIAGVKGGMRRRLNEQGPPALEANLTSGASALEAYLSGIGATDFDQAAKIEAEAKRRGLWNRADTSATGNYEAYGWVPEWLESGPTPV